MPEVPPGQGPEQPESPRPPIVDTSGKHGRHGSGEQARAGSVPGARNRHQAPDTTTVVPYNRVVPESRPGVPILKHPDAKADSTIRASEEIDFDDKGHLQRSEVIETTDPDGNVIQRVEVPGGFDEEIGPDDK